MIDSTKPVKMINFTKPIKVTVGTVSSTIYPKYGCPKTRVAKAIVSAGGDSPAIVLTDSKMKESIPIPLLSGLRFEGSGESEGTLATLSSLIAACLDDSKYELTVNGSKITLENIECVADPVSDSSDLETDPGSTPRPIEFDGTLRKEF